MFLGLLDSDQTLFCTDPDPSINTSTSPFLGPLIDFFLSLMTDLNVPSKSNKQNNKITLIFATVIIYYLFAVFRIHDIFVWIRIPNPCLCLMDQDSDPDPAIFVIDLQDVNKKRFLLITF